MVTTAVSPTGNPPISMPVTFDILLLRDLPKTIVISWTTQVSSLRIWPGSTEGTFQSVEEQKGAVTCAAAELH